MMYTQLIRHLERRPEQYSGEGQNNVQTLLLMDEFERFGKLETITAAMATLRSKNISEILEPQIFPHELSAFNDVLLRTPYGFCRIDKCCYKQAHQLLFPFSSFNPASTSGKNLTLQSLCDAIESAEKRYDARTAQVFIGSLPNELPILCALFC